MDAATSAAASGIREADVLLEMIGASWMSQAICVACELEIPDHLAGGPRSVTELATDTQCAPSALHRLLRGLASLGLCREESGDRYALTAMGALLQHGADGGVRAWAVWWGRHLWPVWQDLKLSVQSGRSVREQTAGTRGYTHIATDPAAATVFNRAMVELTQLVAGEFVRSYDCSRMKRVVDVGGGHGALLGAILNACPQAEGVLYDLPHAIDSTGAQLAGSALGERLECIAGSFFDSVPAGADLYLLKSVLHNWDDAQAAIILGHCRRAMTADARLVVIERMMPACMQGTMRDRAAVRTDLNMMVGLGGRERTEAELAVLLQNAGLRIALSRPLGPEYRLIECVCD